MSFFGSWLSGMQLDDDDDDDGEPMMTNQRKKI